MRHRTITFDFSNPLKRRLKDIHRMTKSRKLTLHSGIVIQFPTLSDTNDLQDVFDVGYGGDWRFIATTIPADQLFEIIQQNSGCLCTYFAVTRRSKR